jgi:anti-sigma B factor antagonist
MAQPSDLKIDVEKWGDISALRLRGNLNPPFELEVLEEIRALVAQDERQIVIDCSELLTVNSNSVTAFIAGVEELRQLGGDLKLIGVTPRVKVDLERLGVSRIIQMLESLEEALEVFQIPIEEYMGANGLTVFLAGSKSATFHAEECPKLPRDKVLRTFRHKAEARATGRKPCTCCEAWFLKK